MKEQKPNGSKQSTKSESMENNSDSNGNRVFKDVPNSPFVAIKVEKGYWILVMGNEQISGIEFDSYENVCDYVERKPYELMIIAATIHTLRVQKINNLTNQNK